MILKKRELNNTDDYSTSNMDGNFITFVSEKNRERYTFQKVDIIMIEERDVDFE